MKHGSKGIPPDYKSHIDIITSQVASQKVKNIENINNIWEKYLGKHDGEVLQKIDTLFS